MFAGLCSAFYCVCKQCSHFFTAHFTALYSPFYSTVKEGHDFLFTAFTDFAKAEAPPKCTAAIGAKVDGKYQKTAAQIGNAMTFCTDTPERFEVMLRK